MGKYSPDTLIADLPEVKTEAGQALSSPSYYDDVSMAMYFERYKISFGQLVSFLEKMRFISCGFRHEMSDDERPFEAMHCPHRKENIACAHMDAWFLPYEKMLHQAMWLVELLDGEMDFSDLRRRFGKGFNELEQLDIGARFGLDMPIRGCNMEGRVHKELLELGVMERKPRRGENPNRPTREQLFKVIHEIQARVAVEMIDIRDRVLGALMNLVDDDSSSKNQNVEISDKNGRSA